MILSSKIRKIEGSKKRYYYEFDGTNMKKILIKMNLSKELPQFHRFLNL